MKRYYSTERPVMPGGYPKPAGNPVKEIVNYDTRQDVAGSWRGDTSNMRNPYRRRIWSPMS